VMKRGRKWARQQTRRVSHIINTIT
jgi:hypothetical protein